MKLTVIKKNLGKISIIAACVAAVAAGFILVQKPQEFDETVQEETPTNE